MYIDDGSTMSFVCNNNEYSKLLVITKKELFNTDYKLEKLDNKNIISYFDENNYELCRVHNGINIDELKRYYNSGNLQLYSKAVNYLIDKQKYICYKGNFKQNNIFTSICMSNFNTFQDFKDSDIIDETQKIIFSNSLLSFKNIFSDFSNFYHIFFVYNKEDNGFLNLNILMISSTTLDKINSRTVIEDDSNESSLINEEFADFDSFNMELCDSEIFLNNININKKYFLKYSF